MEEAQMSVNIVSKLEFNYSFQTFFIRTNFKLMTVTIFNQFIFKYNFVN